MSPAVMNWWRIVGNGLSGALAFGVIFSVLRSGLWRVSRLFPAYLAAVGLPGIVFAFWPKTLTWNAWLAKEVLQIALKLAMATELAALMFAGLPRAKRVAETVLAFLVASALGLTLRILPAADAYVATTNGLPLVNDATALAFGAILVLAAWYRIPMHPMHRAIVRGLAFYLLVFSLALHALEAWGWDLHGDVASSANSLAYLGLLIYWLVVSRTAPDDDPMPTAVGKVLRPWA